MIETLSPDQIAERVRSFRDHERFCRETLTIKRKQADFIPLQLSPSQLKLSRAIRDQERRGIPVRGVVLKARQVHMSVGVATEIWKRCAFMPGESGIVFADTFDTVRKLWAYYKHFQECYRPRLGHGQLDVDDPLDGKRVSWANESSSIRFASAERGTSGHGGVNRHLHLSEYAFWRDAEMQMTRLAPSVPDDPSTTIIIESTANGVGGPFHDVWEQARQSGDTTFALFFAWWEHPEYCAPLNVSVREFQQSISREEKALIQNYGLTFEQINWRRSCIHDPLKCNGSVDRFHQEYPSTAEEAFLTSGRPRFDMISVGAQPSREAAIVGELESIPVGTEKRVMFRESQSGRLMIWRKPQVGIDYVIGADAAEGIDPGAKKGKSDPDYSVACVMSAEGQQVAVLRERLEPPAFADYIAALGRYYNNAFIIPEATGVGVALVGELRRLYPTEWIYNRLPDPTDRSRARLEELGYKTGENSKLTLVSRLDSALLTGDIIVHDPWTLGELRTFVHQPDGGLGASQGKHDDCVIALALAVIGIAARAVQMPKPRPQVGQQPYRRTVSYSTGRRQ